MDRERDKKRDKAAKEEQEKFAERGVARDQKMVEVRSKAKNYMSDLKE